MEKMKQGTNGMGISAIFLSCCLFLQSVVPGIVHASELWEKANINGVESQSVLLYSDISEQGSMNLGADLDDETENRLPLPTGGPDQPEVQSFTPIGTSDMVDPFTGDFSYNIPLMEIDGYPINIAYQAGAGMDQEATWVGLGWNLNPGVVNRAMRGIPDDFNGTEKIVKEYNMKPNWTAGTSFGVGFELAGFDFGNFNASLGVNYNNYAGFGSEISIGASFSAAGKDDANSLTGGLSITGSSQGGASLSPRIGIKQTNGNVSKGLNLGTSINSRGGVSNVNLSYSRSYSRTGSRIVKDKEGNLSVKASRNSLSSSASGSFNIGMSTFTPMITMPTRTFAFTGNFAIGADALSSDPSFDFSGYYTRTWLKDKLKSVSAYGYMNAHLGQFNENGMMDFNRENDGQFTKNTPALPNVALTYDIFTVSGQGVGGSYRPYRPDIGYVFDSKVKVTNVNASVGAEIGLGATFKAGIDVSAMYTESESEAWNDYNNAAAQKAKFNNSALYFREANEMSVDNDPGHFDQIGGDQAVRFNNTSVNALQNVLVNNYGGSYPSLNEYVKSGGEKRNQVIYTLTNQELKSGLGIQPIHPDSYGNTCVGCGHHIAQFTTLNTEGTRYVYGIAAYSHKQKSVSFAVGAANGQSGLSEICGEGRVAHNQTDATVNNTRGLDNHFNSETTPAFAHSYLLTTVLNADYIDADDTKGPSKGDLGGYMNFSYKKINNYKWRTPVNSNESFYDEGLNSDNSDDKGHYVYGEKELWYVKEIKTKNHIAIFHTSPRADGHQVLTELGGVDGSDLISMQKLDSIQLFSLPDYEADPINAVPLKVVHFEYDYSQCKNYDQNVNAAPENGKLTLKKLYFTYQGSHKGRYTPYEFEYSQIHQLSSVFNPTYDMQSVDRWGCYKENTAGCGTVDAEPLTPSDFPYVGFDKATVDQWVVAWNLTTIKLPSGGKIEVDYESDDYGYVQHKRANQMFRIVGIELPPGSTQGYPDILSTNQVFVGDKTAVSSDDLKNAKIYFELPPIPGIANPQITDYNINDFTAGINKLYFRTLMDFEEGRYDFVPGYARLGDAPTPYITSVNGQVVGCLPLIGEKLNDSGNSDYNPISVAAIQFGRLHLSRYLPPSNQGNVDEGADLLDILTALVGAFTSFGELFTGPNKPLWSQGIGTNLVLDNSWVRLNNPYYNKLGGGHRVKEIRMYDAWDVLSGAGSEYFYGQQYEYTLENGVSSSGVAAYEPQLGGDENVWRQPIANNVEYLLAPDARNYQEMPFGEQFFPSPRVGYSRVIIKNLERNGVTRTATGKVVHEFYTAKDFPTITRRTSPNIERYKLPVFAIFFSMSIDEMSASQGFVVENNDMHGKPKVQSVYAEGKTEPITKIEYFYQSEPTVVDGVAARHLINEVKTIGKDGSISESTVGRTYEAVADFRQSISNMESGAVNVNLNYTVPFLFLPMILGSGSYERKAFRSATLTKVIERFGIMENTRATDLSSIVETKNLAYDAETGGVLVTQTTTDFDDEVYSFTYPAHWYYDGMGQAYQNVGFKLSSVNFNSGVASGAFALNFAPGDEIGFTQGGTTNLGWVTETNNSAILVLLKDGTPLNGTVTNLRILRSGRRNLQNTPVGTIALRTDPLNGLSGNVFENVLQAGAVEYADEWRAFCECFLDENSEQFTTNPYVLGLKGTWRPKASYVHLAGRTQAFENGNSNIRQDGMFTSFTPFYELSGGEWNIDKQNWTYTSSVVEFSPFGQALETIDALDRYSSSMFGYNQTLPIGVAANTRYRQLGFDGFEDYAYDNCSDNHFRFANDNEPFVVDTESHTGRHSIRVTGSNSLTYSTQLVTDCEEEIVFAGEGETNVNEDCAFAITTFVQTLAVNTAGTVTIGQIGQIGGPSGTTTTTNTGTNSITTNYSFQATGGTAPFTFNYTIVSGSGTATIVNNTLTISVTNGLPLHVVVEVTDANGCSETVELNQ